MYVPIVTLSHLRYLIDFFTTYNSILLKKKKVMKSKSNLLWGHIRHSVCD